MRRSRKRKFNRRRIRRVKRRFQRRRSRIPRPLRTLKNPNPRTVFPWKYLTKLWFDVSETLNIASGGSIANYLYRINDINNCPSTTTPINSLGYNDASNIYSSYKVYAAKVEYWINNTSTIPFYFWSWANDTNVTFSQTQTRSLPMSQEKRVGSSAGGHDIVYGKKYFIIRNILDKNTSLSIDTQSAFGLSPIAGCYWGFGAQAMDQTSAVSSNLRIKITQYTLLFDMKAFNN